MTFCFLVVEFMIKTMFKEVRYPSGKSWLTTRFILFWADVIFSFYTIPIQLSCPQLKSAPLVAKIFLLNSRYLFDSTRYKGSENNKTWCIESKYDKNIFATRCADLSWEQDNSIGIVYLFFRSFWSWKWKWR